MTTLADRYPIAIGARITLDSTKWTQTVVASDWDRAPFRITTNVRAWPEIYTPTATGYVELACRVEVTGRTVRWINGANAVRVKVTYIHDDEPDTTVGGWMFV